MAFVQDAPKDSFRLGMLIYDTRYRSITIQVVVLILFLLFLSWLVNNTAQNLAAKGRTFDFGFLWMRAGYDINQRLVDYTNDSTHMRAAFIGLLNTLLAAFVGCIIATILGVVIGVLRLSKNWIVSRLMTVYVEIFRNVPVLLWILLAATILSETTPQPRDFRQTPEMEQAGEEPKASMLFGIIAVTNRGTVIPEPKFCIGKPQAECDADPNEGGLGVIDLGIFKVSLNLLALLVVFGGSIFVNSRITKQANATQEATGIRPVTWWKSLAVLIIPSAILLWALGLHFVVPELKGFNFVGGISVLHSFTALTLALALYTAAFIAEIVRAGIMAISRGQSEAAAALGLRPGRTMSLVILPQALRVIIPPLISQYLNLTKNTSLAIAVSYMDLRGTLGGITLNQTGKELECMLLMMGIYLTISLIISALMNLFNRAVKLKER
ncbi:amino acid ABC transporter permease [Gemmobacter serpentinus]|uniref:amino acid ABC transporter permease n=1 Tax=Gemmobacter serpentinus TaxID=2652247 RepID=UPI00124F1E73|nr:ABC transporter permease subunit [Gemmobacter serpentinus]